MSKLITIEALGEEKAQGLMTLAAKGKAVGIFTDDNSYCSSVLFIDSESANKQKIIKVSSEQYTFTKLFERPYYTSLLSKMQLENLSSAQRVSIWVQVLAQLAAIHGKDSFHGHLTMDNIAIEEDKVLLIDAQVITNQAVKPVNAAPDLIISQSSDIYYLGKLGEKLLPNEIYTSNASFLKLASSSNYAERPTLTSFLSEFNIPEELVLKAKGIKTGKIIEKGSLKIESKPLLTTHQYNETSATPTTSRTVGNPVRLFLGALLGASLLFYIMGAFPGGDEGDFQTELINSWLSGDRDEMSRVARLAVENGDPEAQLVILQSLNTENFEFPGNRRLISLAFHPKWLKSLSPDERTAALSLSLANLLGENAVAVKMPDLHPGILLGVLAQIPVNQGVTSIEGVPTSRLSSLPPPYGEAFTALSNLGYTKVSDVIVRSFSHLIAGDLEPTVISSYFASSSVSAEARLRVLLPFTISIPSLAEQLWKALANFLDSNLVPRYNWLLSPQFAKKDFHTKLFLLAGVPMEVDETTALDLLSFPSAEVRATALTTLLKNSLWRQYEQLLRAIIEGKIPLDRDRLFSFLSTLNLATEAQDALIAEWFSTKPPPEGVLGLVLFGENVFSEVFFFHASSYLGKTDWQATPKTIELLTRHREVLIRSLAFSKITTNTPTERNLLQDWAKREPDPVIKEQILSRLSAS